jgi:hypothetical protein
MTDIERESLSVFQEVRDIWTGGQVKKSDFMYTMGHVRDMIKKLESKESGCPTGLHFTLCTCQPCKVGRSAYYRP